MKRNPTFARLMERVIKDSKFRLLMFHNVNKSYGGMFSRMRVKKATRTFYNKMVDKSKSKP